MKFLLVLVLLPFVASVEWFDGDFCVTCNATVELLLPSDKNETHSLIEETAGFLICNLLPDSIQDQCIDVLSTPIIAAYDVLYYFLDSHRDSYCDLWC